MFTNLFGSYLVEKNVITTEQYEAIKAAQAKTRVKLGLIAVAEKLMTQKQADAINTKQQMMDKRFGDIAVAMEVLSREQVKRLLSLQGNPYIQFTQTVNDLGIMTIDEVESHLDRFRIDRGFTSMDMDAIKSGDIDRIIPLLLPEDMSWNFAEHIAVIIRNINRFVSDDILIKKPEYVDTYNAEKFALQGVFGDYESGVSVTGNPDGMLAMADGFAKDSFGAVNEEALDSIGELINIANGLFATMVSQDRIEISLHPPVLSEEPKILSADRICLIPLEIDGKSVDLLVAQGSQLVMN